MPKPGLGTVSIPPANHSGVPTDEPYNGFTVTGALGTAPYVFSLVGTWPTGLSINSSTGEVSGTPTVSGEYPGLSVRFTDGAGSTDDLPTFTMNVGLSAAVLDLFASAEAGLWPDPSDDSTCWQDTWATTPAGDGDPVALLQDKSGNGNHATQATSANQPTRRQDPVTGNWYLEVDGSQLLTVTLSAALTQPNTIAALAQRQSTSALHTWSTVRPTGTSCR